MNGQSPRLVPPLKPLSIDNQNKGKSDATKNLRKITPLNVSDLTERCRSPATGQG